MLFCLWHVYNSIYWYFWLWRLADCTVKCRFWLCLLHEIGWTRREQFPRLTLRNADALTVACFQGVTKEQVRWQKCVEYVNEKLGMAVGRLFVKENFHKESKDMVCIPTFEVGLKSLNVQTVTLTYVVTCSSCRVPDATLVFGSSFQLIELSSMWGTVCHRRQILLWCFYWFDWHCVFMSVFLKVNFNCLCLGTPTTPGRHGFWLIDCLCLTSRWLSLLGYRGFTLMTLVQYILFYSIRCQEETCAEHCQNMRRFTEVRVCPS